MPSTDRARAVAAGILACTKDHAQGSEAAPFNGQDRRVELFEKVLAAFDPTIIIETGTYLGGTTRLMAERSGVPVHSVEVDPWHHGYSRHALAPLADQVEVHLADSRDFLVQLADDPLIPMQQAFFYLDAHWGVELPLADEIRIIFENWTDSVVLIDDFEVPGTEYGFDDYGAAGILTASYLGSLDDLGLKRFYPSAPTSSETGAVRGCIVLCADDRIADVLSDLAELVRG